MVHGCCDGFRAFLRDLEGLADDLEDLENFFGADSSTPVKFHTSDKHFNLSRHVNVCGREEEVDLSRSKALKQSLSFRMMLLSDERVLRVYNTS